MSRNQKLAFGEIDIRLKPKGSVKEVIAKLSRGLMLPIAMLPIAGLFLGIGSTIVNLTTQDNQITMAGLHVLGNILKISGDVVFAALPVLFAIAIAISFTKDSGTAGLSAFVGWLIFNAVQNALIITKGHPADHHTAADGYQFLWYSFMGEAGISKFESIFTSNVGIRSLSTSVFGGIIIGFSVAFLYNKFKNIQLPSIIGFFSGVRFIPIVTFAFALVLGLLVSMVWPLIGLGLYAFGNALSGAPVGINSFIFGLVERSLVPLGLHHAFYAPLWYTGAGGSFELDSHVFYQGVDTGVTWKQAIWPDGNVPEVHPEGDQNLWMFINNYLCKSYSITTVPGGETVKFTVTLNNWYEFYKPGAYAPNPGQYMQGKYPFMMFGLPAAAAAMILVVPKGSENRKQAISIIGSAALASFLTGITEPLEFTFLFLAPWLFWGIHAPLCGISFWLMNILRAHMGMTFSGGALDFIIYGVVPDATGHTANCYWAIIIGLVLVPIYYLIFRTLILKFDIKTPGRGAAVKMFTKADFRAKGSSANVAPATNATIKPHDKYAVLAEHVIAAYGGATNIKNVDACITKLRVQVVDQKIVDKEQLLQLGARGVIKPSPQSVYAVFGNEADVIKNKMNEILFPGE